MRIVTNEILIKRNRRWATGLFFFSLIVLGLGFIAANGQLLGLTNIEDSASPLYMMIMPIILVIGFTTTLISVNMTNQWLRVPRPEDAIQLNLKGINNKSALYNYYHSPAKHVLVTPNGIFAIITRFQDGKFSVDGDKWKTHRSFITQIFSLFRLDGIGNPTQEAEEAAAYIRYITEDYNPNISVQPLIIFVSPNVQVEIINPTVPVLYTNPKEKPNLKDYLKDQQKLGKLQGPEDIEDFISEFENATLDW